MTTLNTTRKITLTLKDYYQQYCLPLVVSNHRLWIDQYEQEATEVTPVASQRHPQFYRVTFTDKSSISLPKDHLCTVEILPGTVRNR